MLIQFLKRSLSSRVESTRLASRPRSVKSGRRPGRSGGEVFRRLAAAVKTKPGTGGGVRLGNEVLVPVLVILLGALWLALALGWSINSRPPVKQFSGTDGAYAPQPSLQAVSSPPAVAPVAAGVAQGKSRKTKRPEKKSATPAAAVSEPSFVRVKTKKRSPASIQPASEPVAKSPAPSSGGASGSNDPPPQVQKDPPPQVQHGIGDGEASHGIAPAGG